MLPTIEDLPNAVETPRERLLRSGVHALSEVELLSLMLGGVHGGQAALPRASRLLHSFGGAPGIARAGVGALEEHIGTTRACWLVAAVEFSRRVLSEPLDPRSSYSSSREVVRAFFPRLVDHVEEFVYAVVLDGRMRPRAERVLAQGAPTDCAVALRQVFSLAIREGGAAVLLVHNHPSGDPLPSEEDRRFTAAVERAGEILEIPLIDHVIVARDGSFSFLDAGLLARVLPRKQEE